MKVVVASGNPGKLAEFARLLEPLAIDCIAQSELGISDIEETGLTFVENALLKARNASRCSRLPALADDSGLCVNAIGGAPGLRSARYAGPDADPQQNIARLLAAMADIPHDARDAYFHASIVLLRHAEDPQPIIAEGRWPGRILHAPRGTGGFGYDPVFLDPVRGLSAAELEPELKARISHRGQAVDVLKARLVAEFLQ